MSFVPKETTQRQRFRVRHLNETRPNQIDRSNSFAIPSKYNLKLIMAEDVNIVAHKSDRVSLVSLPYGVSNSPISIQSFVLALFCVTKPKRPHILFPFGIHISVENLFHRFSQIISSIRITSKIHLLMNFFCSPLVSPPNSGIPCSYTSRCNSTGFTAIRIHTKCANHSIAGMRPSVLQRATRIQSTTSKWKRPTTTI